MSISEEEREHLKAELEQALQEDRMEPVEADEEQAELAYDITPAAEPPEDGEADDGRQEILTAFLVYIDTDGKAIATTEIEKVLEHTRRRREADLPDFMRACAEVVEDVRLAQQARASAQASINAQMQMVAQAQQAAQDQQLLQGLDLSKVR